MGGVEFEEGSPEERLRIINENKTTTTNRLFRRRFVYVYNALVS